MMDEIALKILKDLREDFQHYAEKCLLIRSKSGHCPFILNKAQRKIHELVEQQKRATGKVRAIILKGRQQGCSTYIEGRFYWLVTHTPGHRAFILTHDNDATNNLFEMAQRFHENCPKVIRPKVEASNAKELVFSSIDSGYKLGTAGNKSVGRSSTIQLLHGSEVSFWPNATEHAKGILQAVPNLRGTEIFIESTANGVGNWFHEQWQLSIKGESEYIPIFIPWYWQDEYCMPINKDFELTEDEINLKNLYGLNDEQINWRRCKIMENSAGDSDGVKAFMQEYPCIVGSQRIGTNIGIIPIKEIYPELNTYSGKIKKQWCTGLKDTIKVKTELGYELECTYDHKILCINNKFIEAKNLKNEIIKLSPPMFSDKYYCIYYNQFPCVKNEVLIDEDFGLFLGYFMGDGSYGGDVLSIAFDKKDSNSKEVVKDLVLKLFDKKMNERETSKNGIELRVHFKEAKQVFFMLDIIEKKSYGIKRKIHIPECIWKSPKSVIKNFIKGLFDSDGFASDKWAIVKFFSKHEQFVKDVQLLLLGFGITSRRSNAEKISGSGHIYLGNELSLRASESRLFSQEIGFISDRKQGRVSNWLNSKQIGRKPNDIGLIDTIKSITPQGKQIVYDLEMYNETHTFDAQGICVHNCNAIEAFQMSGDDSFINPSIVMTARKSKCDEYGSLLVGVDPARFGSDRTSIIRRRTRKAYGLQSFQKKDTMEVTGIVHKIIMDEKPQRVFIDVGGLGAGIYDRLVELGHKDVMVSVNGGSSPLDQKKYLNKRAEMWDLMKECIIDQPFELPDSDSLHSDLCNIKYRYDSKSRLQMEKKEDMKKRGIRSPDEGDALALTFALPNIALQESRVKRYDEMARDMFLTSQRMDRLRKDAFRT